MSAAAVTHVTRQSWISRLGDSIKGILFGLILIVGSIVLLFWNEGRSVKRYKDLKEGAGVVVSVQSDRVDATLEGSLIHTSGMANTESTLKDPVFDVSVNALRLERLVEMYQWEETSSTKTEKKLGGATEPVTTYDYRKTWHSGRIDSSGFQEPAGHENPDLTLDKVSLTASDVTLGDYHLTPMLVDRISNFQTLSIGEQVPAPAGINREISTTGDTIFVGDNQSQPQIGDLRIRFRYVAPQNVSVIAAQSMNGFEPYKTSRGGTILEIKTGLLSTEEMFAQAQASNRMITWLIRLGGFVLMGIGFGMLFRPLSVVADVVPFIGNIIGAGTGFVGFLIAAILSLITIAVAWLVYRPVLGIGLLVVAGLLMFWLKTRVSKAKPASPLQTA
ncbi:MAG: TMEM43 family protein [Opitutales bacterium]|nr:TMEM43 family protein [Opitutales bacterium]